MNTKKNIGKLLMDRVLVEIDEEERKTESGLIIQKPHTPGDFIPGIVRYVGRGKVYEGVGLVPIDPSIVIGGSVLFQYGIKVSVSGESYMLVSEADIVLTLE